MANSQPDTEQFSDLVAFLTRSGMPPLVLQGQGLSAVAISPHLSGRVIAITSQGAQGRNPYYVNTRAITHPDSTKPYDAPGGGRGWSLLEGQPSLSFFFPQGTRDFSIPSLNRVWRAPFELDRTKFNIVSIQSFGEEPEQIYAQLEARLELTNVKGNKFPLKFLWKYEMQDSPVQISPRDVSHVGFRRLMSFENLGEDEWNREYGWAAPWILDMLGFGEDTWIILPVKPREVEKIIDYKMSGKNRDSEVPANRFLQRQRYALLSADGKAVGKKGLLPEISTGYIAAIDLKRGALTVMDTNLRENRKYLDNRWEPKGLFGGTAIDTYTDDGKIGKFFELEFTCPFPEDDTIRKYQKLRLSVVTHHFQLGNPDNREILYGVLRQITGVDLSEEGYK